MLTISTHILCVLDFFRQGSGSKISCFLWVEEMLATMQTSIPAGALWKSTGVRRSTASNVALFQSHFTPLDALEDFARRPGSKEHHSRFSSPLKPFFSGDWNLVQRHRATARLHFKGSSDPGNDTTSLRVVAAGVENGGISDSVDGGLVSDTVTGTNSSDGTALKAASSALEARVVAAEKERKDALEALQIAEAKAQENVALTMRTTEEAMMQIEAAKELFKAELKKVLEEKSAVERELLLAKQEGVNLAVKVEKVAQCAVDEVIRQAADDAKMTDTAAKIAAADRVSGLEESIRSAAADAAALVVSEAGSVMDEALAAAALAREQARKAQDVLVKGMEVFEELAIAKVTLLSLQEKVSFLSRELNISEGMLESLRVELKAAELRIESANGRAAKAEATVEAVQLAAAKDAQERDKKSKQVLESIKTTIAAKTETVKEALGADVEALQAAYFAAQEAATVQEQANLRMSQALEKSLAAAEASAEAWRNRALTLEELLNKVKDEGSESVYSLGTEEIITGGRMDLLLGNDSRKRDLLANGPRRETPEWMKRRIEVGLQGLPPRTASIISSPVEAKLPLHLPGPEEVWLISSAKVNEDDLFTKQAVEKEALDEQRRALERALQKRTGKKHLEDSEGKQESGTGSGREIVFQGFNWESWRRKWYLELAPKAADLSKCGITTIWLPPPTESVSPQGYMPGDLYNLNSAYGTIDELKQCIEEMHNNDILVLGDAVLNHRCAQKQSSNGIWNIFGGKLAWGPEAIVKDDPNFQGRGNPSSGDFFHAAPNIDHSQDFVRKDIKEWMKWLRSELGFDGWRLDFVRGFWGGYVKEYIEATDPAFAIGEYWDSLAYEGGQVSYNQDAHRQRIINWINAAGGTSSAFDVTTKGILHSALHNEYWRLIDPQGKPPGVMGWWPSRAVTFLENHDTGSTQGHWPFPRDKLMQGYAYILTHPGTPVIFYDHFYDFGLHDQIAELIAARKRTGVHCRSLVKIFHANFEGYVAQIGDNLIMKLGRLDWNPSKENNLAGTWERFLDRGTEFQLWERK